MKRILLAAALALSPLHAPAQETQAETDKGYLAALLEENLSGAGRQVTITGFAGALSSRATIQSLSIADGEGVWITLNGVTLDWSRSALLLGVVDVTELSADEIILTRPPVTDTGTGTEAKGFSLPDLPVSIDIGSIAAKRIALGPAVLGEAVEARLSSSMSLAGGEGKATLLLERTDGGPAGKLSLDAAYSNATKALSLKLTAAEAAGGIAVRKLGLPGSPATELTIDGTGPLDAFAADIALRSDGVDRLAGRVTLTGTGLGGQGFDASLAGDLAPLFLPEYASFFGNSIRLTARGESRPDGTLDLQAFDLAAQAIHLSGAVQLAPDYVPLRLNVQGEIGLPDGSPVLLPLGATETRVTAANLSLGFNAAVGTGWRGRIDIQGLDRAGLKADRLTLNGSGNITHEGETDRFDAAFRFAGDGVRPDDPALAAALGTRMTGRADLGAVQGGSTLDIRNLSLDGTDYSLDASGTLDGLTEGFRLSGKAQARLQDLTRLSALAGRPLSGAATLTVTGNGSPLGGEFDLIAGLAGQNVTLAQPQLDRLLSGRSTIKANVSRNTQGTTLRALTIDAGTMTASATGRLATEGTDLGGSFALFDLGTLDPAWGGSLSGDIAFQGVPATGRITATAKGSNLRLGQAQADRLLAGASDLTLDLALTKGRITVNAARLTNPQLTASATGTATQAQRDIDLTARLANLGLFLPEFPGPVTVTGTAIDDAAGYDLNLRAQGPGQIDARLSGRMAQDFGRGDLAIKGSLQAGLFSPFLSGRVLSGPARFDLALNGPLSPASLSGQVSLTGGRIADPALAFGFEAVTLNASLRGGSARITASTRLSSGGQVQVNGSVGLAPPFGANLQIALRNAVLRDPRLFQTSASGDLALTGPLAAGALVAGRIDLGETELQIPSTGFGGSTDLAELRHLNEPAPVRATRDRAGLLARATTGGGTASRPLALDLRISAPSQVFIRGRGLDAELGGSLTLRGTTANVQPAGSFSLIRGRLDILGRRLVLSEATLLLEGEFLPTLAIAASTESDGITSYVRIDGPATSPEVTFTSTPELPEEEVLSRLLFGRGLENLSALQAAQLANAVATLAGRGGASVIDRLRQGFGLDDLDVQTDETGAASLTVGKYLSKNVYTEVEVGQNGQSQINLNLDISKSLTLRGSAGSTGGTGVGLFWEKDY
ncbi:translocation/assembly module TamB domain-containing protein [Paragemmobacter straminiformis]|uniref:Translocation/assembly module TamB domain-containing protein n=1 Tax=Paragemmobacter straminiformis TaxID=2045119 RepID=A0A842I8X1_9RHOB|nr:translocation/assembly module TamB domain-containing protein [Gemmobacter straminiformis]MBC2836079.1 translocation/assembly module TamB domain-containing protein [Gemmobacter straminiformis]